MINYHFNEDLEILEVNYSEEVDLNQLLEYGEMIKNDRSLPRDLKILTDATKAVYRLQHNDIINMMEELKEQVKPYKSIKTAVIQEKPVETALSMVAGNQELPSGYKHHVFSTRQAALNWLLGQVD